MAAKRLAVLPVLLLALLMASLAAAPRAHASTIPRRIAVMNWANHQIGKWYCWAGAGPSCFDCSGLVMAAYAHTGVALPHSTFSMLADRVLIPEPIGAARRGDLMFYGDGHVELKTIWPHVTLGALEPGTRIGRHRWNAWWHPTMAFRVRGAG
jgi:cell wall-associated NlpC family hydrolase